MIIIIIDYNYVKLFSFPFSPLISLFLNINDRIVLDLVNLLFIISLFSILFTIKLFHFLLVACLYLYLFVVYLFLFLFRNIFGVFRNSLD